MDKGSQLRFAVDENSVSRMDRVIKVNSGTVVEKKVATGGVHYLINKL